MAWSLALGLADLPRPRIQERPESRAKREERPHSAGDRAQPVGLRGGRNPYLTSVELEFFRELGPRLWVYAQVWFHVRRVIAVEVSEWDSSVFGQDLEWAQMLLASAPDRAGYSGMSEVDSVVRSYGQHRSWNEWGVAGGYPSC